MLALSQIKSIKERREKEGQTLTAIAHGEHVDWRTAKKYADEYTIVEGVKPKQKRVKRVLDPVIEYIDAMLEEDLKAPRKQRRSATAIFRILRDQCGYQGSDRSVRGYVQEKKRELKESGGQFVRLDHAPGTAQVDFGQFRTIEPVGDEEPAAVKRHELVMSFPHSGAHELYVLPAENSECFLEGLKAMFEKLGGVPPVIWLDNLAAAVVIKNKQRVLTNLFRSFLWHYRFEVKFCNPGKGNEKGHVENKVGYTRRNALTPPPVVSRLDELNAKLDELTESDRQRNHYLKGKPIAELFKDDQMALLPLPRDPFLVARSDLSRVNKYGEIKVGEERYRVPQAAVGQLLFVRIRAFHLEVFNQTAEKLLATIPRHYALDITRIDWVANLEIFVNKPRAVEQANCLKAMPKELRDYILSAELRERPRRIKSLMELLQQHHLATVENALKRAKELGINPDDLSALRNLASYQEAAKASQKPVTENVTPSSIRNWHPNLQSYNLLQKGVADNE